MNSDLFLSFSSILLNWLEFSSIVDRKSRLEALNFKENDFPNRWLMYEISFLRLFWSNMYINHWLYFELFYIPHMLMYIFFVCNLRFVDYVQLISYLSIYFLSCKAEKIQCILKAYLLRNLCKYYAWKFQFDIDIRHIIATF